jgi:hypothetical protein
MQAMSQEMLSRDLGLDSKTCLGSLIFRRSSGLEMIAENRFLGMFVEMYAVPVQRGECETAHCIRGAESTII